MAVPHQGGNRVFEVPVPVGSAQPWSWCATESSRAHSNSQGTESSRFPWARQDLNLRPIDYESTALTN